MRLREKWHLYLLALLAVGVAALAVLEIGPPSSSARTARELITAEDGVVQSTVSGTGNVEAGTDEDVNFRTSGTLEAVYVSTGQHVKAGQLLAQLNPASAQLALDQAQESLTSAEDQLTATENGTASGGASGSSAGGSATGASYTGTQGSTEFVSDTSTTKRTTTRPSAPASRTSTPTRSSTNAPSSTKSTASSSSRSTTATTPTTTTTTTTPSPSAIASAQAAVYGAQANVDNAEQTLAETKLYAPVSGTIASMANLVPGDAVSGGSTSTVSGSSSASSSGAGSGGDGASTGGTSTAGSLGGSSGSSSSSGGSSSSSPFAEIVNTSTMSMTVAFSESDISKIKVGQPATITMDALAGVELAAHVSQISDVGTTSSSVVSYDATLTVDQTDPRVKPGMSASASVIVDQAQGVSVPNAAVTGSGSLATVNLDQGGKTVQHQVVVGLRGDSRTQIISGLSAGQQLVVTETLPSLSTSATGTASGTRGLGSGTLGGGGLSGGGLFRGGGLSGGGGGFFRGGG
jgi:multidrug efflux pump subunit AcrA (membrane-fusion protein)